ncbi:MAG TPA: transposase [Vicinamibacterales bacterium]|nr:transposase [Vicinamibacterales bacterium]
MTTIELGRLVARRRWTDAEGRAVAHAWRRSGLTVAAFARRHGLDEQRVRRWARRGSDGEAIAFVPVDVVDGPAASVFEVSVGGVAVRVPADFDAAALRRLLGVLTAC